MIHLAKRFFGSLRRGLSPFDAWALTQLSPDEREIWARMSDPDRRHAVGVAREVVRQLSDDATRPVVAAALLHDAGKVESGLGTFARAGATLAGMVRDRDRWEGRIGAYLRHDVLGAALLERAGSDPLTVTWAREHHLPSEQWTLAPHLTAALKAADDD